MILFGSSIIACVYANEVTKPFLNYTDKFVAFIFLSGIFVIGIMFHPLLILLVFTVIGLALAFSPIWILFFIIKLFKKRREAALRNVDNNLLI
jgi:hypothetical protein